MQKVIDELRDNHARYLEELIEVLRIPSISPGLPNPEAMEQASDWIVGRLKSAGIDEVQKLRAGDKSPVVWGRKHISDSLPTVLFYGHYDVMPPDPLDEWESPPFEPQLRNGELYGRGTADDKGQFLMHVNAVEAYLKIKGTLPVNAIFAIEGEEEEGSPALEELLDTHRDLLLADVAVVSDSPFFARDCPSICYGLRGIAAAEIRVIGPNSDLHSGNFGGAVANPAEFIARVINDLKDRQGRITIDGFYDDVLELTDAERKAFTELPFDEEGFKSDLGIQDVYGEDGFTTLERIWARPTFEVNGIGGGFQEEGFKTIIPSGAFAKVTMRLVPNQDPLKILDQLENHVMKNAPEGVEVVVEKAHFGYPFLAPIDNPHVEAGRRAMEKGFGQKVYFIRDGASIPIVTSLNKKLGATCLLMGVDVPDGRIHAPNEKLVMSNFHRGMEMIAYLLEEF
ncbi:MAG TPA: dipeptidase [Acidobacteriota bacterium]|nr:dipeptidase [Acidobacteriota bacterium]